VEHNEDTSKQNYIMKVCNTKGMDYFLQFGKGGFKRQHNPGKWNHWYIFIALRTLFTYSCRNHSEIIKI